jgi:hypothetical protein
MQDREIAYEQNVTGLEIAWKERIEQYAATGIRKAFEQGEYVSGGGDAVRDSAREYVSTKLLNSLQWENVEAIDISDIALEAVEGAYQERESVR